MTNVGNYIDFFRSLAVSHQDIKHNPGTESGDGPAGSRGFGTWTESELIGGMRGADSSTMLLIEMFETGFYAGNVFDIKVKPRGSFTVICNAAVRETPSELAAYAKAERITYDILRRIWQLTYGQDVDRCSCFFKDFDFGSVIIQPTGRLGSNEFGFYVQFEFELQQVYSITESPEEGVFL